MKLAITYNHLPSDLFLEGVNYTTDEARGSGSMGDVFVGVWGEKVVAIKRPIQQPNMKNPMADRIRVASIELITTNHPPLRHLRSPRAVRDSILLLQGQRRRSLFA